VTARPVAAAAAGRCGCVTSRVDAVPRDWTARLLIGHAWPPSYCPRALFVVHVLRLPDLLFTLYSVSPRHSLYIQYWHLPSPVRLLLDVNPLTNRLPLCKSTVKQAVYTVVETSGFHDCFETSWNQTVGQQHVLRLPDLLFTLYSVSPRHSLYIQYWHLNWLL